MRFLDVDGRASAAVGLAVGPYTAGFVARHPGVIDYVESAFEQLRHDPTAGALQAEVPLLLHCASLSLGGTVAPDAAVLEQVAAWTRTTGTPWIGEHIAFLRADPFDPVDGVTDGPANVLTFTVCPQLGPEVIDRIAANAAAAEERFGVPIILENPPVYFPVPGSTLGLVDFLVELGERTSCGFLLDLTHLLISAENLGFDARAALDRLPLERVVELHLSGIKHAVGLAWDDHTGHADQAAFELLDVALTRARPRAVTLEYNARPDYDDARVAADVARVRACLAEHGA